MGKQQCCQETPRGAREETGLWFIALSLGRAVKAGQGKQVLRLGSLKWLHLILDSAMASH